MTSYIPDEVLLSTKTDRPVKIFVSYAHAEAAIVDRIFSGLKARGHDVWFDQQDIVHDDDWREKIYQGIESSNGVLSFLSQEAISKKKGGVCLDELAIAVGVKYGNIHPVLLEKEADLKPPAQLTHRQWLDMSDWKEMLRQGEAVFQPWFNRKLADIIRVVESEDSREFVGQISTIREKLRLGDLAVSKQHWYLTQKYVGRAWLTQDIEEWLDDPQGGRLCTVYGGPGVGKSAFAAQYTYHSWRVAASIFFEHGNEHFNTAGALIRELVFQLSCRLPLYRNRVYGILTTDEKLKTWNEQELFAHLVKAPLAEFQINGGHETLCIVVDGLDECTLDEHNSAAELLGKYVREFPAWLRMLVLSRRESSVTGWLYPDHQIDMLGGEARNLKDIRLYFAQTLKDKLAAQPNADTLLDELTRRTEGVFLYAYVVTRMILDGKLDIADTEAYPWGLNSAFREWFRRYFPDVAEYRRLYRLYLGMIAASPEPIPVEELDAVNVRYDPEEDCYELDAVSPGRRGAKQDRLKRINSLLQYRTNMFGQRTVAFTHQYIAEWLTQTDEATNESPAGYYYSNPQDALWAMERTWRRKLEDGEALTGFEALHLLDFTRKVERDRDTLKVAKDDALQQALQGFAEQYDKAYQYEAVLLFSLSNEARCKFIWQVTGAEEDELVYIEAQGNLATAYYALGRWADALAIQEKVFEASKRILPSEHPDILTAMNNLAVTYRNLGCWEEALALQEKVYELSVHILGAEHSNTLIAMTNLVAIYCNYGHPEEALALQEKVVEVNMRILGAEHPDTLMAMNRLASTYRNLGRQEEALALHEKVVEVSKRILPPEHPDILTAMNNLALTYKALDHLKEALVLQEEVVEVFKRILPSEHPDTLIVMRNIAATYFALGRREEALALLEKVVEVSKRILPPGHPDTLTAMNNLAATYHALDRLKEALVLQEEVVEVSKRILPSEHPDTLIVMSNLATTYFALGRPEEALALLKQEYEVRRRHQGEEHPSTLTAMNNLTITYRALGRPEDALALLKQEYEVRRRHQGEEHPATRRALNRLVDVYMDLDRYSDALALILVDP